MLIKTHLTISLFFSLLFLPYINNKIIFLLIVLLSSVLPDIDCGFSTLGEKKIFKPIQFFTKHRGILHSFTLVFIISIILSFFHPFNLIALPFFLGYSLHLLTDSFTVEGIEPFWPWKKKIKGNIKTAGMSEKIIFYIFSFLDLLIIIFFLVGIL